MADVLPVAIRAADVPPRARKTNPPEPFAARMAGRDKRPLGDLFGLTNLGVNLTSLSPGGESALRHAHTRQGEFVYILSGHPTLMTDAGETRMERGMCAGFKAGTGNAHHLVNRSNADVLYLEIGDRSAGDAAACPDDDLQLVHGPDGPRYGRRDGSAYGSPGRTDGGLSELR